jgi:hypothetical protein
MWEENRESGRGTARRGEVLSNTRTVTEVVRYSQQVF